MPIRSEGARDYVDGLLSMKNIPNVTVTDMPQLLVRHAKTSRKSDILRTGHGNEKCELFFPFEGRAGDCNNSENMRKAKERTFNVSFPFLSGKSANRSNESNDLSHPGTGSAMRLALVDRFHENNAKSDKENLRKLQCVKELHSQINSQVAEQLHKSFNANKRFLNAMSPLHFAFLLRSMLNHRNELRNQKFIEKEESKGYDVYRDEFGRIRLRLGFHKNFTNLSNISENNTEIDFNVHDDHRSEARTNDNFRKDTSKSPSKSALKSNRELTIISRPLSDVLRDRNIIIPDHIDHDMEAKVMIHGNPHSTSSKEITNTGNNDLFAQIDAMKEPYDSLIKKLDERNLEDVDVPGDGNCFFHAVANMIEFQKSAEDVRAAASHYFLSNPEEFIDSIVEDPNKVAMRMHTDGSWADHYAVQATADALGITVDIISSDSRYSTSILSVPKTKQSSKTIVLGNIANFH